jgi:hypothetical protein
MGVSLNHVPFGAAEIEDLLRHLTLRCISTNDPPSVIKNYDDHRLARLPLPHVVFLVVLALLDFHVEVNDERQWIHDFALLLVRETGRSTKLSLDFGNGHANFDLLEARYLAMPSKRFLRFGEVALLAELIQRDLNALQIRRYPGAVPPPSHQERYDAQENEEAQA